MEILQTGWRAVAGLGALAAAVFIIALDALSPDYEILYRGSLVTSACPEVQEKKLCAGVYRLDIANSGDKRQDDVRATWGIPLDKWTAKIDVSDLVAQTKPRNDPVIVSLPEPGRTVYRIGDLEPNTVVEFKLTCPVCSPDELKALKDAPLKVTGMGSVTNTEPRWTIFGRAMRNLERLVRLML